MSKLKEAPKHVFVVHGEERASLNLEQLIEERYQYKTSVPRWGEIVELATMESSFAKYSPEKEVEEPLDGEIDGMMKSMRSLVEKYQKAKEEKRFDEASALGEGISDLKEYIEMLHDDL